MFRLSIGGGRVESIYLELMKWKKVPKKFLITLGKPFYRTIKLAFLMKKFAYLGLTIMMLVLNWGGTKFYFEVVKDLPNINEIYNPPRLSSKILDRNGELLYKFYEGERRSWIPLGKIPESLIWATLAIEDKGFYQHRGISWKGVIKAVIYNFRRDSESDLRGGSTITQQLVKNVFLGPEKTWQRKAKEVILALMLERRLSKGEILERYFNQVAYGGEVYGVEEASLRYFEKHVWEIEMAEATFLAGLPAAPSSYSPFGDKPNLAYLRQKHVINEMVAGGYINEEKATELKGKKLEIKKDETIIRAPHFVFYIKNLLEKKYGVVKFGIQGLTVTTSLDIKTQEMAEKIVEEEMKKIGKLRISNGAALILEVKEGNVLAMVGSKDYDAKDIDGKYNVTTAWRQPGSAIKPINYLLALERGRSLASMVEDSPVTYYVKGQKPYSPKNYNGKFMGNVTLRTALGSSLNVPSVKLLAENGVNNMIDLGKRMGITTWEDRDRFGLSLALGGGEVKMIDLAGAYSVFANLGEKVEINPILKMENYLGEVIYEKRVEANRVVGEKESYLINEVLTDNNARAPIFGTNSKLVIPGKTVAAKTGTTNNLKDNWCIGWTPSYLTAVWVGNNDGTPMSWVASGVTGATPIWNRIMSEMVKGKGNEKWQQPMGVYRASACGREEYFINGTENTIQCLPTATPTPSG